MDTLTGSLFLDILKIGGFPVLIAAIWYLTIKFFDRLVDQINKRHDAMIESMRVQAQTNFETQARQNQQNFELLKQMIEGTECIAASLALLTQKIDNNQFCPLIRKETRG